MLSHILGEVGTFYTVLLNVSSRTCLPIFIEIHLYFTDLEQKISCPGFSETQCIIVCLHRQGVRVGVLSGPGHCTKKRRRRRQAKWSPVGVASVPHRNTDTTTGVGSDTGFPAAHQGDSASV